MWLNPLLRQISHTVNASKFIFRLDFGIQTDLATMSVKTNLFLVFLTLAIGVMNIFAEAIQYFELTSYAGVISILTSFALLGLPWIGMRFFKLTLADFQIRWIYKPYRAILDVCVLILLPTLMWSVAWGIKDFSGHIINLLGYFTVMGIVGYVISACIQEYVFRGIFLELLMRSGVSGISIHMIVLISSVLFSVSHEVWGFPAMVFTLFGNIILSYIYIRQKSLMGVCVLHAYYGIMIFPLIVKI